MPLDKNPENTGADLIWLQNEVNKFFYKLKEQVAKTDTISINWYRPDYKNKSKYRMIYGCFQGWKVVDVDTKNGWHHTGAAIHDYNTTVYITKSFLLLREYESDNGYDGDPKLENIRYVTYNKNSKEIYVVFDSRDYVNRGCNYSNIHYYGSSGISYLRQLLGFISPLVK